MKFLNNQNKVIFLFTPGPLGGAEKIVAGGFKALQEANLPTELWVISESRVPHVTKAFTDFLETQGITYRVFNCDSVLDFSLIKNLKKSLVLYPNAIIHAHGFKAAFYAQMTKSSSQSFVVTHHGKTGHTLKVRIYEFIEVQILKRADQVVAVSHPMKEMLQESKIKPSKITVIENFLTNKIPNKKKTSLSPLKILFVGRLSPEKGCSTLIKAVEKLDSDTINLTIVGDGEEREMLKSLVLSKSISFLGFRNDIPELMAEHDLLAMPSFREGLPLALIEACCIGLPVIASNVGGIPGLVEHKKNGFLVPSGDENKLSEGIKEVKTNYTEFSKEAEILKNDFQTRFSQETWVNSTIDLYKSLPSHS